MNFLSRHRASSTTLFHALLLLVPASLLHAQSPRQQLAASTISLNYDSPPRPTDGTHYRITIQPNHTATFWYVFGPGNSQFFGHGASVGPLNPTPPTIRIFPLTPATCNALLDTLLSQAVFTLNHSPQSPPTIGGPRQVVTLQLSPKRIISLRIPPLTSTLPNTDAIRFVKITEALRATLPDAAWIDFNTQQRAYENSHP